MPSTFSAKERFINLLHLHEMVECGTEAALLQQGTLCLMLEAPPAAPPPALPSALVRPGHASRCNRRPCVLSCASAVSAALFCAALGRCPARVLCAASALRSLSAAAFPSNAFSKVPASARLCIRLNLAHLLSAYATCKRLRTCADLSKDLPLISPGSLRRESARTDASSNCMALLKRARLLPRRLCCRGSSLQRTRCRAKGRRPE